MRTRFSSVSAVGIVTLATSLGRAQAADTPTTDTPVDAESAEAPLDDLAVSEDTSIAATISAEEEGAPKLDVYGFADFRYTHFLMKESNQLGRFFDKGVNSFMVGHLNMYLAATLSESWRSLAEVRFTYLPQGTDVIQVDGSVQRIDTRADDYAEFDRPIRWGGIVVERVYLEYTAFDFLSFRVGQWLTPYGFWNEDHGTPTIVPAHRPFVIGEGLFPERQTGVQALGQLYFGDLGLQYFLTVSNGRGPTDAIQDLDRNKAVGGRVLLSMPFFGELEIGTSVYRGKFTDHTKSYVLVKPDLIDSQYRTTVRYDELSASADLRWRSGEFLFQTEFMMNETAFDDSIPRPPPLRSLDARQTAADFRRWGFYTLIGFRTPWLNAMPFIVNEYYNFTNSDTVPEVVTHAIGVNIRPTPRVVLKAEYQIGDFLGTGNTGFGRDVLKFLNCEAAWAF